MGMDYRYAGSASYPRYEEEIVAVAMVFGGRETKDIQDYHEKCLHEPLGYWFGYMFPKGDEDIPKFAFPEGTPEIIMKWLDHPYDDLTPEETKAIWKIVESHPEIQEISSQIWSELKQLVYYDEGWEIS